jgi:hypothetical protein
MARTLNPGKNKGHGRTFGYGFFVSAGRFGGIGMIFVF